MRAYRDWPRRAGSMALVLAIGAASLTTSARAATRALTIEDAVALALEANPRLAAARARLEAGEDSATSAARRMLPVVHVSEEAQRWNAPFAISFAIPGSTAGSAVPFTVRDQNTNTFSASAVQPVLGLLRANDERASLVEEREAARAEVAITEADIRANVQTQFLRVFEARALEQIAQASVRELGDQVKVAKARLANGVITNADLLRIEVAVANAQQQGLEAQSQGETARAQLFAAMGIGRSDAAALTLVEPSARIAAARSKPSADSPDALLPGAAAHRPELMQSQHLVLAADRVATARGYGLLPDINLEASYLRFDGQPFQPKNSEFVGVKAEWNIWEWGASNRLRHAAAAQAQAARHDREALGRQVEAEVAASLAQGNAARGAVDAAERAVTSAEEAYRVTNVSVQAGAATTTDLLESQAALTQARLNLIRAQYELALSEVALTRATGG
jgi:outer membrane protein